MEVGNRYRLFFIWITVQCAQEVMSHHMEVTGGGFWKALPSALTYEATVPMIYQTIWQEEEVKGSKFEGDCNRPHECTMIKGLEHLRVSFENEFSSLTRTWSPAYLKNCSQINSRRKRALDFLGGTLSWCCGVATQHKLDVLTMDEQNLKRQLIKLSQGMSKSLTTVTQNSEKFVEYENSVSKALKDTEERIHNLENYIVKSLQNSREAQKEETYFFTSIWHNQVQNLKHIIYLTRAIKRQSILNSCRQHQIPIAILDPAVFRHDLDKLGAELASSNQKLAIPIEDLSRYFQLPICDCGFSENKLVVTIRIPTTQKQRTWQLFELTTTPFAWENQTCVIEHKTLFLAVTESFPNSKPQVRQISGSGLRHCQPFKDKLCYLPRFSADMLHGHVCAKMLYYGASIEEISHNCPMRCHKSINTVISEIAEETYVITHPKNITELICQNFSQSLQDSAYTVPGSIKLYLPCHCELNIQGEVVIPKRFPCSESMPWESTITHIIPAAWSKLKSFVLKPNDHDNLPKFLKPDDCLNRNWTLDIPHFNFTSVKDNMQGILENVEANLGVSYSDVYGQHSDTLFFIWNIILSIAIGYIIFGQRNNVGVIPAVVSPVRSEGNYHVEHDIQFGLMCIGVMIIIGYFIIKILLLIYKNKRKSKSPQNERKRGNPSSTNPFPQGKQLILHMGSNVDLTSLKPGHSLECVLQETEVQVVESSV